MTYDEFLHQLENLNEDTDAIDIYTSPDFQCDQTGGFPTSLCVNWDKGKAWLQLNDNVNTDGVDAAKYEQLCADYGIRDCPDTNRFSAGGWRELHLYNVNKSTERMTTI